MKYSVFILLLITFSFSIYSDNQKLSITEAPQDYSIEYRQKEYLEIFKLFESLFGEKISLYDERKRFLSFKKLESLIKSLKGKSLTFSFLELEGSIHKLSETYEHTEGFDDSYLNRLKKNSKNKKELYLTKFSFPSIYKNTGYNEIPDDIDKYISERPHLKIVTIAEMEREALYSILNEGYKKYAISGKIDHLQYQDNPRRLLIFIK
ncbi:hypothetical protein LEP1GSC084_1127 [Leptospira interrogans serovar Medanensis str. L0448]|uniref:hypothetical protein n=1 Tax=Leptospira interrogans TaxID=173 RepID=UPI000297EADD|nr:hypothetical protein [Leptospira interrogans]EKR82582.1 hypothetical protein LEP1GSC099_1399 [Leptospira interrogans str. UI 08452]EMN33176.1 hypothetical protein LEP1GSC084_1127 [Leptospira interrogans serovar Medanensis str. L0448]